MERFYRALAGGLPVGEALRTAKLGALGQGAPASDWAAFTLVGHPLAVIPLRQPRRHSPYGMAGAAIVLTALALGWRIRKRRAGEHDRERVTA